MERGMLWFKCAAMHDPVRPVLKRQAALGWEAKNRKVDLVIERPFKGEELLHRMKGWFTADVYEAAEVIKKYGVLKTLDDYHLVVETKDVNSMKALSEDLKKTFGEEVWVERIEKRSLE
ncbi:MAG: hypothetical protein JXN64_14255 [Spirochaetes bacterium]|nr:hypothetical protein [Spirochaetota bacterium]